MADSSPLPSQLDRVADLYAEWQTKADELGAQHSGRIRCATLILSGEPARRTFLEGLSHERIDLADGLLCDVLGAEASRLRSSFGWHNMGCQSEISFGPLVKYFGTYEEADLDQYLDAQDALDRLLAAQSCATEAVSFQQGYHWILNLFGFTCSQDVGPVVQRRSFDASGNPRGGDPLRGEGFRSFLQGKLALGEGFHLCVLPGDVRTASQAAIQSLLMRLNRAEARSLAELRAFEARWQNHFEAKFGFIGFHYWDLSDPHQVAETEEFEADKRQQERDRAELYARLGVRPAPSMPIGWRGVPHDKEFTSLRDLADYLDTVKYSLDVVRSIQPPSLIKEIVDAIANARIVLDLLNILDRPPPIVPDSEASALEALDVWRVWARTLAQSGELQTPEVELPYRKHPGSPSPDKVPKPTLLDDDASAREADESRGQPWVADEANFRDLLRTIPAYDPGNADWISNKSVAKILGVSTKRLTNLRHDPNALKIECDGCRCGVHNQGLLWRAVGNGHPKYYLPRLREFKGHLVTICPSLNEDLIK